MDLLAVTGRTVTVWYFGASPCQHCIFESVYVVSALVITVPLNLLFVVCQLKYNYHMAVELILVRILI